MNVSTQTGARCGGRGNKRGNPKGALLYMVSMYVRGTSRMPEHTGCFASLRSGERRATVLPILVLRLWKSAAGKSVLGTRRRKTSRPRGREVLSFQGLGPWPQQVFCEWPASCPTCEFRKWGAALIACSRFWGPASSACDEALNA